MHELPPSAWVRRFAALIPEHGRVLDVASGSGRHARLLVELGHEVEAVDRDAAALGTLAAISGITARVGDLETGPWPYDPASFDGVVVTNYLHRPRFDALLDALRADGVLIYETFMVGNEAFGRPSRPEFLLQPNELLERVRDQCEVIAFEQGFVEVPKPAMTQRIAARKVRQS